MNENQKILQSNYTLKLVRMAWLGEFFVPPAELKAAGKIKTHHRPHGFGWSRQEGHRHDWIKRESRLKAKQLSAQLQRQKQSDNDTA